MFKQLEEDEARSQLRDSVAAFVRKEAAPQGGNKGAEQAPALDTRRWRQMASLGWLGLQLPEAAGGLELAAGDLVALHQEIGRGAFAEPLIPVAVLAARPVALSSNDALKQKLLPGLLGGEVLGSLAWQKATGCVDADDVGPTATASGNGWVLEGEAVFVPIADEAQGLVVAARAAGGTMLFWVDRKANYTVESATLADGTHAGAKVRFDRVRVSRADLVADTDTAREVLAETLDTASVAACGELLGAMEQMLEMTVAYMNQRVQFGKPIGSFQSLQHKAVDVYVQVELSRSVLHHAVQVCENAPTPHDRAVAVARAKSRCSEAGLYTVKQCIQMHGAIAYTEEYALSRFVRRAIALAHSHGTAAAQRRRYASLELNNAGH
ncbi:acyl-CoA dehydrogenase family protein [Ramlibacter sp.]|uniref:acyl-CoA dehydrogenase family protein n=1 Tax=Ramlibacter sp. TaxID=1917967 RepID=UPI003D12FED5